MVITKKVIANRIETLKNFGLVPNESLDLYCYLDSDITITHASISTLDDTTWKIALNDITAAIERLKDVPASIGELIELAEAIELKTGIEVPDRHKANKEIIAGWKKKCEALQLKSLDDKETYKAIASARSFLRKQRTTGEKMRKSMVEDSVAYQKKVNGTWKEYETAIEEIEDPLQKQLDQWENWKNEAALAKEREEQKLLNDRVALLLESGMHYDPQGYYCIGEVSHDIVSIKTMLPERFDSLVSLVKKNKSILDEAAELERIAEETRKENERKEREEFERKQKEFKEAQEKQERENKEYEEKKEAERKALEEEKAAIRKDKLTMRHNKLLAIGLLFIKMLNEYQYGNIRLDFDKMEAMDNDQFNEWVKTNSEIITEAKLNEEIAQKHLAELEEKQKKDAEIQAAKLLEEKTKKEEKEALEYSIKSNDLINLGMKIDNITGKPQFLKTNEFNNKVFVDVFEVKCIDMDMWPDKLMTITDAITALNEATETRRKEIAQAKERALPEIVQLRNYIERVWDEAKNVPQFGTQKIDEIKTAFYDSLYKSTNLALHNLTDLANKI